jgi:hypothetical protein
MSELSIPETYPRYVAGIDAQSANLATIVINLLCIPVTILPLIASSQFRVAASISFVL